MPIAYIFKAILAFGREDGGSFKQYSRPPKITSFKYGNMSTSSVFMLNIIFSAAGKSL